MDHHQDPLVGDENVALLLYKKRKGTVMVMQKGEEGSGGERGGSAEWATNSRSRIREVAATFERRNGRGRGRITVSQRLQVDVSPFTFQQRSITALKENVKHEEGSGPGNHFQHVMGKKRTLQKLGTNMTRRVPGPVAKSLDKENQKKCVQEDAKSFFARKKALRVVEQKATGASVPKNVFKSQASNSPGPFSRAVAARRSSGGRGIVFTRATPLDLSDLQEYFARLDQEETLEEEEEEEVEEPELQVSFFRGTEAIHVARDEVEKKYEEKADEALLIQAPDLAKPGEIADQESQASADEILEVQVTPRCEQHAQLRAGSHEPHELVVEEEVVSKGPFEIPDEESQAFSDEIHEVQVRQGHEPPVQLQARSYKPEELVAEEDAGSKPWMESVHQESQVCGKEILEVQVTKWCGQPKNQQVSQELLKVGVEEDVVPELQVSFLREVDGLCVEREAVEICEEEKDKAMLTQAPEKHFESAELKSQVGEQPVQLQPRSQELQDLVIENENVNGYLEMEDVADVSSAEKVEFELSHGGHSVELWSVEFNQRHGRRDSFLLNEIRSSSLNPIQHGLPEQRTLAPMDEVSPKSPPPQTAQHLQVDINRNTIQHLTVPVPDTSPTPPTNPLSIFGPRYSRISQSVELHQRRLFIDDEDGRHKPWTVDSAIVQPVESVTVHLLEHEQEDLATKTQNNVIAWTEQHRVDGDVDAMNKCSASNQDLQAASELGAQGGTSSPSGNHLVDMTGTIALVSTGSPSHDDVHDVDVGKDLEGSKAMCEDSVQASEQAPGGILFELSMLEPVDQPMTSNNEAPLPFQEPAVPECGRDVSTIDMPIDEHAEDQQSNVGTSQAEQKLADAEFAPSACNTEVTPKKQQKQERQLRRKRKQVISPLDAGTKWQDGQRVSTRIKSKPLEWWRGERMLYGRVHSSLPTLIGIKHYSPDPVWPKARPKRSDRLHHKMYKVDSFVPEEYNEMIRLAAL